VRKGLLGALAVTALLVLYVVVIGQAVVGLLGSGSGVGITIGVCLIIIPVVALWYLGREWMFASHVQRMADELAARGALPVDDLPRSPGGRIDRAAADAQFAERRAELDADPDDWGRWFNLGFAYDAAGDRRRARGALRHAAHLHDDAASSTSA
jgi:cytochrome c-type biogenesis protein CcmH/NrfG